MAAGTFTIYNKAKKYLENGTIVLGTSVLKMMLAKSTSNASTFTLSTLASITVPATGGGYTSKTLGSVVLTQGASAKQYKFSCANVVFSAVASNIVSVMYAVIGVSGGKLLCWSKLSTAVFNVTAGNTLTVAPNASGIFTTV